MASERNNVNFRRISKGLNLTNQDVVDLCAAASLVISTSHADGWRRNCHDERGRYRKMTNLEFDIFCKGLEATGKYNEEK